MRYSFCILFIFFTLSVGAQNISINGFAPNYKSKEITLYTYADYISNIEIPVTTQIVSDSGLFYFSFQSDNIKRVLLRCGKQKANMYVEPGRDYKIYLPARD